MNRLALILDHRLVKWNSGAGNFAHADIAFARDTCEYSPLILTSNPPFARLGDVFGDHVVVAAMIDRIVHHADVITRKGARYRLKDGTIATLPSARPENTTA